MTEREIIAQIAAAGIRLRFDKVALRFVHGLKAALAEALPADQAVVFTVTAPIRLPARTAAALAGLIRASQPDSEIGDTINGNHIRLLRMAGAPVEGPRVLGFVHNPDADAGLILALAQAGLRAPR